MLHRGVNSVNLFTSAAELTDDEAAQFGTGTFVLLGTRLVGGSPGGHGKADQMVRDQQLARLS